MKKNNVLAVLVIAVGIGYLTTSCSSNNTASSSAVTALTATAGDESQAGIVSDDVDNEVDNYVTTAAVNGYKAVQSIYGSTLAGPVITIDKPDSTNFPKTFTIDYGTAGITGKRGNVFKGKIIIVVSGRMNIVGSSRTVTFVNFSVNGNGLTGKRVFTYSGLIANTHPYWTISVKDTLTRTDGTVIWDANRVRERVDDNGTPLIYWDDNYSISGGSTGINAKGVPFTSVIDPNNPLQIGGGWPFFTKGIVTITSGANTFVIDYGNGTKDKLATVTINGVTHTITLRE